MNTIAVMYRADLFPAFGIVENEIIGGEYYIHYWEFEVTKNTPKGVWISVYGKKKFILLYATKKYACATKEEALYALLRRKQIYQKRLQETLDNISYELKALESLNIQKP